LAISGNQSDTQNAVSTTKDSRQENDADSAGQLTHSFSEPQIGTEQNTTDEKEVTLQTSVHPEIVKHVVDGIVFDPTPAPMVELIRLASDPQIYVSLLETDGDGYLQWTHAVEIQHEGLSYSVPHMPKALYRSLNLPSCGRSVASARELFDSIWGLLREYTSLSENDSKILTYWAIATWFRDELWFLPTVVITGAVAAAEPVLRTLAAICRRSILLAGLDFGALCASWLPDLNPTLLIRTSQLGRRVAALLDSSSWQGYLVATKKDIQSISYAKCIYLEHYAQGQILDTNVLHVHVDGTPVRSFSSALPPDVVADVQSRLLLYRFKTREWVATSKFRVTGLRPEFCAIAESLAASILDDSTLQADVIQLLKQRDHQSRVDRASGENGIVIRATLALCHEPDIQQAYVRDIATAAIRICNEEGESLRISSGRVGYILKYLGLFTQRLGNAGRGLKLDRATQFRVHKLAQSYEVLPAEPVCGHCQELQATYTQEFVNSV
jgi:hypothetical protein